MNYNTAHALASEMTNKLLYADDFFEEAELLYDMDLESTPEEYAYAIKSVIVQRLPFEAEDWRLKAKEFLRSKGIE
jgi:hypothetical protein